MLSAGHRLLPDVGTPCHSGRGAAAHCLSRAGGTAATPALWLATVGCRLRAAPADGNTASALRALSAGNTATPRPKADGGLSTGTLATHPRRHRLRAGVTLSRRSYCRSARFPDGHFCRYAGGLCRHRTPSWLQCSATRLHSSALAGGFFAASAPVASLHRRGSARVGRDL